MAKPKSNQQTLDQYLTANPNLTAKERLQLAIQYLSFMTQYRTTKEITNSKGRSKTEHAPIRKERILITTTESLDIELSPQNLESTYAIPQKDITNITYDADNRHLIAATIANILGINKLKNTAVADYISPNSLVYPEIEKLFSPDQKLEKENFYSLIKKLQTPPQPQELLKHFELNPLSSSIKNHMDKITAIIKLLKKENSPFTDEARNKLFLTYKNKNGFNNFIQRLQWLSKKINACQTIKEIESTYKRGWWAADLTSQSPTLFKNTHLSNDMELFLHLDNYINSKNDPTKNNSLVHSNAIPSKDIQETRNSNVYQEKKSVFAKFTGLFKKSSSSSEITTDTAPHPNSSPTSSSRS